MLDIVLHAARAQGGYLYRHQLLDLGLGDRDIAALRRARHLIRLRHGTYAAAADVEQLTPEQRHLLIAHSIVDKLDGVVMSHHTAAIAHTGTSWGVDLDTIHLTRVDGRGGRQEAGVAFHVGAVVPDDDVCLVNGRPATVPTRAAVESCSLSDVEAGMVTASFIIRTCGCTIEQLRERMHRHERWPGMLNVRLSLGRAEPECESVGEVRSLYLLANYGLPRPEIQRELRRSGLLVARPDFLWPAFCHVGEFDGLMKYGRLNPWSGADVGLVLVEEKRREDAIRALGLGMSRWVWSDLAPARAADTAARIAADLERSRRVHGRNATHVVL